MSSPTGPEGSVVPVVLAVLGVPAERQRARVRGVPERGDWRERVRVPEVRQRVRRERLETAARDWREQVLAVRVEAETEPQAQAAAPVKVEARAKPAKAATVGKAAPRASRVEGAPVRPAPHHAVDRAELQRAELRRAELGQADRVAPQVLAPEGPRAAARRRTTEIRSPTTRAAAVAACRVLARARSAQFGSLHSRALLYDVDRSAGGLHSRARRTPRRVS
jgi:hypothetical protein